METAAEVFKDRAFRKPGRSRNPINKPLFEAWSVNFAKQDEATRAKLIARRDDVREVFLRTYSKDYYFEQSISASTGDPKKVSYRFSKVASIIKEAVEL
jgi:hypothetical protein